MQRRIILLLIFPLLINIIQIHHPSAFAQSSANSWRPKDGVYAEGNTKEAAEERCKEFGVVLDLSKGQFVGSEQVCKITKLKQTSTIEITLDLTCKDAVDPEGSDEHIRLKRIDDNHIFFRETMGGKFNRPGAEMTYCSDEVQQAYIKQRTQN